MATQPPALLMGDVRLREVTDSDLPVFFEQQCDPEANQMAAFPARDRDAFWAHWTKILADPTKSVRTILLGDEVTGNIGSWEQDGQRLVGYWIGKTYWGKGVATAALSQFLNLVEARPLYAHVAKHNFASIRVLQKCGFTVCVEETASPDRPIDGVEELVFKLSPSDRDNLH